jgi:hypothetical protein
MYIECLVSKLMNLINGEIYKCGTMMEKIVACLRSCWSQTEAPSKCPSSEHLEYIFLQEMASSIAMATNEKKIFCP